MRTPTALLPLVLLLLAGLKPARAQEVGPQRVRRVPPSATPSPASPAAPLDEAQRTAVVEELARQLEANYVFSDVGRRLAAALRQRLRAGAYRRFADAIALADTLTRELRRGANGDLHLTVFPPGGQARRGPVSGMGPEAFRAALAAQERPRNHYFRAVEVLPGNVGYLALDQFAGSEEARATAAAAMGFLAHTDAILLDLRQNPGGIEGMNQVLSSYFFAPDTSVVLYTRYNRERDATTTYRVLADVAGPRRPDVPLYILVSARTGSAAENIAYALQTRGRATVVGQTTAGAANSSRPVTLPHGFGMSLPYGRVISPITGTNWEGVGVVPDVATTPDQTLSTAHALALRALLARAADEATHTALQQVLSGVEMRSSAPLNVPPDVLARYAGRYGERTLRVENGTLVFQRDGGGPLRLVPLSDTDFAFENDPTARLSIERDASGAATALRVTPPGAAPITAPRTGN